MTDLKIRVYKDGDDSPATTVTIPGGVLKIASRLIPRRAVEALDNEGIDIQEIIRLSESGAATGTLAEIEDHRKNERVVIALE